MTVRVALPKKHEDAEIEKILMNAKNFSKNLLKLEAFGTCEKKKNNVILQFKIRDMWDLQIVQKDILCEIFLHRFVSWLCVQRGVTIEEDCVSWITGISQETGSFKHSGFDII